MEAILEAVRRDTFGKNEGNRLRMKGQIPATIYGGSDKKPESLSVDPKELSRLLHSKSGANTLISLKIDGGGRRRCSSRSTSSTRCRTPCCTPTSIASPWTS